MRIVSSVEIARPANQVWALMVTAPVGLGRGAGPQGIGDSVGPPPSISAQLLREMNGKRSRGRRVAGALISDGALAPGDRPPRAEPTPVRRRSHRSRNDGSDRSAAIGCGSVRGGHTQWGGIRRLSTTHDDPAGIPRPSGDTRDRHVAAPHRKSARGCTHPHDRRAGLDVNRRSAAHRGRNVVRRQPADRSHRSSSAADTTSWPLRSRSLDGCPWRSTSWPWRSDHRSRSRSSVRHLGATQQHRSGLRRGALYRGVREGVP